MHLENPSAGSANPSSSLGGLWTYVKPALDHLIGADGTPNDDTNGGCARKISVEYYSTIHSHIYNYFTTPPDAMSPPFPSRTPASDRDDIMGHELYVQLDKYFSDSARELLLDSPQPGAVDHTLIRYTLDCFHRYTAGAQSINRLLSYVNRHYVKRAVDDDRGWLRITDVLKDSPVSKTKTTSTSSFKVQQELFAQRLRERRLDELKKWGYVEGGSVELLTDAEACAEAASSTDRVVPLVSLAHRRFRLDFIEPQIAMLTQPTAKSKKKIPKANSFGNVLPKGRLARAIEDLLNSKDVDDIDKRKLAQELAKMFRAIGVRSDHPLRKRLGRFTT